MIEASRLKAGLDAARSFLESRRTVDGLWGEFQTLAGQSDEWVSGFIVNALAQSSGTDASVLAAIKALLRRQRWNGGWSYNAIVPPDCDSSAWALLAYVAGPLWKPSSIDRAIRYIKGHQVASEGGFATYSVDDSIDRFIGAADPSLIAGWTTPHPCVTGAVVQALLVHGEPAPSDVVRGAIAYLLRVRETTGAWRSYWWTGFAYSTYHALRALCMARALDESTLITVSRFFISQQHDAGGWDNESRAEWGSSEPGVAFETSFSVLSLLLVPSGERVAAARKGISWLLRNQREDGSWASAPILRIPPPMVIAPDQLHEWRVNGMGTGVILADEGRLFASASALWALSVYSSITD